MLLRLQHQVILFRPIGKEAIYKEAWRDWLFEALATIPKAFGNPDPKGYRVIFG